MMTGCERKVADMIEPITIRISRSPQTIEHARLAVEPLDVPAVDGREQPRLFGAGAHDSAPLTASAATLRARPEHGERQDPLLAELGRLEHAGDLAVAHDEDPVAHRDHLGQLRRDQQHAAPPSTSSSIRR